MKKLLIPFYIFFAFFSFELSAQTLKVMSYNIRLDAAVDGENRWDNRKDMLAGQVLFYEPDFLGVQEALSNQMAYLNSAMDSIYGSIGVGREDGKNQGEFSAIFYNKTKYKLLEHSTFWLSETTDKPSMGWDAAYKRVCTYGKFRNLETKQELWVFNTHFDHVGDEARSKSATLILNKIKALNKQNLPFVLTGDFNLEPETAPIEIITQQLNDSKASADFTYGPEGTYNGFNFNEPVTRRIDYIFTSKNGVEVTKYAVLSNSDKCRYPSDHLPVYIDAKFKKSR